MNDLSEFQQRAAAAAIVRMLSGRHFSICDLDAIAATLGLSLGGRDYAALRALHCMEWGAMSPDLVRLTREKCLELLGMPPQTIDALTPEQPNETPTEPARRLRLAFWRSA